MAYVDGFIIPIPKDQVQVYKEKARICGDIWMGYGALSYVECVADDVPYGELTSFPRAVQVKPEETVIFSWITYESRQQRDQINAKVMADARMKAMFDAMPIDGKRMIFGGFEQLFSL
jgi:uncharacterized protein YbaA (DUF1428 family)